VLFRKTKNLVGLDIGSSAVKLVELKDAKGGGYRLVKTGLETLSPEAIVDGAIMDASLVVDTVNRIIASLNVRNSDFGTSLSGHSVIIKKISLPAMSAEELAESIRWEAEQYVPFDINDVNLDYVVLEGGAGDTMDVLLVAVKKDKISDYTSVITQAGKTPLLVDVDAFALQNAYELAHESERDQTVGLVNLGAAVMNINIIQGGVSEFTRDSALGGNRYTESIQKMLGLSYEQAETLKLGGEVEGRSFEDARPAIDMVNAELAAEIRRSFDFFRSSSHSDTIHRVVLSGGCARLPGLVEYLSENLEIPSEVANPLRHIKAEAKAFDPEYLEVIAPQLAVSVGLALRQAGDK
jgi:type IV pilus assembly protein PilM